LNSKRPLRRLCLIQNGYHADVFPIAMLIKSVHGDLAGYKLRLLKLLTGNSIRL